MVVEDDVLLRMALSDSLRESGFQVVEAAHADEALSLFGVEVVDLVVTDVSMPGPIDGLALASRLTDRRPSLPIIVVSGHLPLGAAQAPHAFFAKPYDIDDLVATVRRLLRA
jgi:DNA-binding NtrC family response regulator